MTDSDATGAATRETLPVWPVETDIYILPSGEVVVADLPAELRALVQSVGLDVPQATEFETHDHQPDQSD